jgi:hypothetical protein
MKHLGTALLLLPLALALAACAGTPTAKARDAGPPGPGEPPPVDVAPKARRIQYGGGTGHAMQIAELQFRRTTGGWESRTVRRSWFDGGMALRPGEAPRGNRDVTTWCTAWRPAAASNVPRLDDDAAWPAEPAPASDVRDPRTWPAVKCYEGDLGPAICEHELVTGPAGWNPGPERAEADCG